MTSNMYQIIRHLSFCILKSKKKIIWIIFHIKISYYYIFSVQEYDNSIKRSKLIMIYKHPAVIPICIHTVFIIPKNGTLKVNKIRTKPNKNFHSQKPLWIRARKLLLLDTPIVTIIKKRKNKTIAIEKR